MVRVYVASNMKTDYPYKLQKPSTKNKEVRKTASSYIADSGIGEETSNEEVIEWAKEYNADYVVGCDELHSFRETTESIKEFIEVYKNSDCDSTPMVPVQCNPEEDKWHTDHLGELPEADHYVLGGMAVPEVSTRQKIESIKNFRDVVGEDVYVHGLGVGGGMEFVSKVAGTGWLDSIDCSTPEQAAMFGCILDGRLRQKEIMEFEGGEGRNLRVYAIAQFNSFQLQDVWDREEGQKGLGLYG